MEKQILINNEPTVYYITEDGRLHNRKTNNWYKGTVRGGYLYYDMRWKNKKYSKAAHRLVAEYYILNENNYSTVNHIDGNKLNNHVSNLEWCTESENLIHAYETGLKRKTNGVSERQIYKEDLPDEIWRTYKDTNYLISNKGRIRNNKTKHLLKGKITSNGYVEWCLNFNGKKHSFLAHRLVYQLFGENEINQDYVINHIDGNKQNNDIMNLEQISSSENVKHSYYTLHKNILPVGKYDLSGNLLQIYPSCAEAARQNPGCYSNLISRVCNGQGKTHKGFKWCYIQE